MPVDRIVWDHLLQAGFLMSLYEHVSVYGIGYELRIHLQISKELVDAVEKELPTLNVAALLAGGQAR